MQQIILGCSNQILFSCHFKGPKFNRNNKKLESKLEYMNHTQARKDIKLSKKVGELPGFAFFTWLKVHPVHLYFCCTW